MTIIVQPVNDNRIREKDGSYIQFFDKPKQMTNEDLETVNILDEKGNKIYDLYVEISHPNDPFSIVCKKVEGNIIKIPQRTGAIKKYQYTDLYKSAYEKYKELKNNLNPEINLLNENEKLKAQIEALKQEQKIIIPAKNLSKAEAKALKPEAKALKQQENNLNELE